MLENPSSPGAARFSNAIAGREIESFEIANLFDTRHSFVTPETNWASCDFPVCFTAGTLILTDLRDVPIETLKQGDLVQTLDNGLQPIRWISAQKISRRRQRLYENMRPIRIKAGALGGGLPSFDLFVIQQHRMVVRSKIAQKMFGKTKCSWRPNICFHWMASIGSMIAKR